MNYQLNIMNYNPYNRNKVSEEDIFQQKQDKLNDTKKLIFGNSMNNTFNKNNNIFYNLYNQKDQNTHENRKDNNILIPPSISMTNPNINYQNILPKNNSLQNNINSPYLIYLPIVPFPQNYPIYPPYQTQSNINISNSQQIFPINNNLNLQSKIIDNSNDYSLFGLESKLKDDQRLQKKEEYRKELLEQIKEKKKADEERNKKMKEEEKNEIRKNEEYYRMKKLQADEQERKLRERIARRMQKQQAEEFGYTSNIFEISKDFENMNKSRQGKSLLNNIELTQNKNTNLENDNNNNLFDFEENYDNTNMFGFIHNNILLEQENYKNQIDNEYNELCRSIKTDIDEMINKNKLNIDLDIYDYNEKLAKKEKQYSDYIFGKILSPPTPFKLKGNQLSYSYNPKQIELFYNNTNNNKRIIDKNKKTNLEDFFNKDEKRNYRDKKNKHNLKEIKNKIDKEYFNIFENLQETHSYTKKYSSDKYLESHSESYISDNTHNNDSQNKSNNETKNKFYLQSYYNSTVSNSMYEKEQNKNENENEEENAIKIEDSSMKEENKNKSKTLLDKKLINIKENKEDEEDEEEDEENKKIKEEQNTDNNENAENINIEENYKENETEENHKENNDNNEEKESYEEEEDDNNNNEDKIE